MRRVLKAAVVLTIAGAGLLVASPAQAADANSDFGQHVRACAQTMGFDGTMNPGMHQGRSGWDPSHDCPMA
ncbi:hypothetical protein N864_23600 [Intrasporangium chromatireducens Q5-1]|uniref:Uncharacterized protein n=1 Tax=Intrasporangium chromatireducens Q5-1 TaxID=584657 RepID=W9GRR8_9MICO|nr:hypothetical protein N864_23600 [Intrasporangium chromatireducens Q5-1]